MRVHHVPVRRTQRVQLPRDWLAQLPPTLCLATTSQFLDQLESMQAQLEAAGKQVIRYQQRHTWQEGQVLGCSTDALDAPAFLFVGEGLFHPQALAYANEKPVYTYDPVAERAGIVPLEEIERRKMKRKAGIASFHHASRAGVLVSTKAGQRDLAALQRLREQYPEKTFYAFLGNTLSLQNLEDFPFVQVWLNTACPRIGYDDIDKVEKPLVNAEDVLQGHRF